MGRSQSLRSRLHTHKHCIEVAATLQAQQTRAITDWARSLNSLLLTPTEHGIQDLPLLSHTLLSLLLNHSHTPMTAGQISGVQHLLLAHDHTHKPHHTSTESHRLNSTHCSRRAAVAASMSVSILQGHLDLCVRGGVGGVRSSSGGVGVVECARK